MRSDHFALDSHDKYGNIPERALFETELAKALIESCSTDFIRQVNIEIIQCITDHPHLKSHMIDIHSSIKWDLKEENLLPYDMTDEQALNYFIQLLSEQPVNLMTSFCLHRLFFERHFDFESITPKHPKPNSTAKLGLLAQTTLQNSASTNKDVYKHALACLMPEAQFSEKNRGRKDNGVYKKSLNFGITDSDHIPKWALNWHANPSYPAKDLFTRDRRSPLVKFYEQNNIPFIAGPSGTTAFCLLGLLFLLPVQNSTLLEYANLLAASLIAKGHHSYYDVMLVANNLKIMNKNFKEGKSAISDIDPCDIYNTCLTPAFKASAAHEMLATKYPEYLENSSKRNKGFLCRS